MNLLQNWNNFVMIIDTIIYIIIINGFFYPIYMKCESLQETFSVFIFSLLVCAGLGAWVSTCDITDCTLAYALMPGNLHKLFTCEHISCTSDLYNIGG